MLAVNFTLKCFSVRALHGCCVITRIHSQHFELLVTVHIQCYSISYQVLYCVSTAVEMGPRVAHFLFRTKCNIIAAAQQ